MKKLLFIMMLIYILLTDGCAKATTTAIQTQPVEPIVLDNPATEVEAIEVTPGQTEESVQESAEIKATEAIAEEDTEEVAATSSTEAIEDKEADEREYIMLGYKNQTKYYIINKEGLNDTTILENAITGEQFYVWNDDRTYTLYPMSTYGKTWEEQIEEEEEFYEKYGYPDGDYCTD